MPFSSHNHTVRMFVEHSFYLPLCTLEHTCKSLLYCLLYNVNDSITNTCMKFLNILSPYASPHVGILKPNDLRELWTSLSDDPCRRQFHFGILLWNYCRTEMALVISHKDTQRYACVEGRI